MQGFKNKLNEFINIDKKIDEISTGKLGSLQAYWVRSYLEKNGFIVDPNLNQLADKQAEQVFGVYRSYDNLLHKQEELEKELMESGGNPYNFRHVIYGLMEEEGIESLEELDKLLECKKGTFYDLYHGGKGIDKDSYLKTCAYFQLDSTAWSRKYVRNTDES